MVLIEISGDRGCVNPHRSEKWLYKGKTAKELMIFANECL